MNELHDEVSFSKSGKASWKTWNCGWDAMYICVYVYTHIYMNLAGKRVNLWTGTSEGRKATEFPFNLHSPYVFVFLGIIDNASQPACRPSWSQVPSKGTDPCCWFQLPPSTRFNSPGMNPSLFCVPFQPCPYFSKVIFKGRRHKTPWKRRLNPFFLFVWLLGPLKSRWRPPCSLPPPLTASWMPPPCQCSPEYRGVPTSH